MVVKIRGWELSDATDLALALSNKKYKIIFGTDYLILTPSRTERIISLQCFLQMKTILLRLLLQ